jgi:hypothetical protein
MVPPVPISHPTFLPVKAIDFVQSYSSDPRIRANLLQPIDKIMQKQRQEDLPADHYVDVPRDVFREHNGYYNESLEFLKAWNVIQTPEDYSKHNHQCKTYRINPAIAHDLKQTSYTLRKVKGDTDISTVKMKEEVKGFFNNCTVDLDKALKWTDNYTQKITIADYNTDHDIKYKRVKLRSKDGKTKHLPLEAAVQQAHGDGKTLINISKSICIIDDPDEFIRNKRLEIKNRFKGDLKLLNQGIYQISQSPKNYRVFSNFTNLKSELIDFITFKGENLAPIDMMNSQFALLANEIKGNNANAKEKLKWKFPYTELDKWDENSHDFVDACLNGTAYEMLQKILGLDTRDEAKTKAMEIVFSRYGQQTDLSKQLLKSKMPSLMAWVKEFKQTNDWIKNPRTKKKEHHQSSLPIYLQRIEANLFTAKIWSELKRSNIDFITKHDEVLVPESQWEQANEIIRNCCAKNNLEVRFKGKLAA